MWRLDIQEGRWDCLCQAPFSPRQYHTAVCVRDAVWVVAGGNDKCTFPEAWVLNLETRKWKQASLRYVLWYVSSSHLGVVNYVR